MRPFPDALLKFCSSNNPVQNRPWWTEKKARDTFESPFVLCRQGHHDFRIERFLEKAGGDEEKALVAFDLAHPLPQPPYCAGQVWGNDQGQTVVILQADDHALRTAMQAFPPIVFGALWPFLLADPVNPRWAPWSPTL